MIKKLYGINTDNKVIKYIQGPEELVFYDGYEENGITYLNAPEEFNEGEAVGIMYWDEGFKYLEENPTTLMGLVISNIPINSRIEIDEDKYEIPDGGTVTLELPLIGEYLIIIKSWGHLDKVFEYENNA